MPTVLGSEISLTSQIRHRLLKKTSKIEGREFTAVHLEDFRTALREIVLKIFCGHLDKQWLESNEVRVYKLD